jgi:DNA-binding Lrp family transcriptional regulator
LNDLDDANDIALLNSLQHQAPKKVIKLNELAKHVGLQTKTTKTKTKEFTESSLEIILNGAVLEKSR